MRELRSMRAVIYARESVFVARQGDRSVQEQVDEAKRWCDANDVVVAETVVERRGTSGAKADRHGWEQVRGLINDGSVDILVTWSDSRAQRGLDLYTDLRRDLRGADVLWCYDGRVYDMEDEDDRFHTAIDAVLSERQRDRVIKDVKRAMRANARAGVPHGRILYGYRRVYDPETGRLVAVEDEPEQATAVRRIFAAYLSGRSQWSIAHDLEAAGVPAPEKGTPWVQRKVSRILRNPAYKGRRYHLGRDVAESMCPAIVDEESWDRAQERMRVMGEVSRRQTRTARLLTAVARCSECKGRLYVMPNRGDRCYQCRTRGCFAVTRNMGKLDAFVRGLVVARFKQPDAGDIGKPAPDVEVDLARKRVAALRRRLAESVALFKAEKLSPAMLAEVEADLNPKIAEADRQVRNALVPIDIDVPSPERVEHWWDHELTAEQRRETVAALFVHIDVHPTGQGQRTFDPSKVVPVWREWG